MSKPVSSFLFRTPRTPRGRIRGLLSQTLPQSGAPLVGAVQQDHLWDAFRHQGIVRARAVEEFLAVGPSYKNGYAGSVPEA